MSTRNASSLAVAVLIASALVSGCAGPVQQSGPASAPGAIAGTPSVGATGGAAATATTPATPAPSAGTSAGSLSSADLARMRRQLDAMQREINSLKMPTDDDFNSAAGELY